MYVLMYNSSPACQPLPNGRTGFCMSPAEDPSLRFLAKIYVKDQVLGNTFGGTFSDSFRQKLSPHPHWQDILQSTCYQIWDFLPSCWGCLLTLWLKICVPNDRFGFSGDDCLVKLPAKFYLQFWMVLSPNNTGLQRNWGKHKNIRFYLIWGCWIQIWNPFLLITSNFLDMHSVHFVHIRYIKAYMNSGLH